MKGSPASRRSFISFLSFVLIGLSVAPVMLFGSLAAVLAADYGGRELLKASAALMASAASEASRYLEGPRSLAATLAARSDPTRPGAAEVAFASVDVVLPSLAGIRAVVLLDSDARVVAVEPPTVALPGGDFSRVPVVAQARKGGIGLSKPFVNQLTGTVEVVVAEAGRAHTVLVYLELEALSSFLRPLRQSAEDAIAILDPYGDVIAHTDPVRVAERRRENDLARIAAGGPGFLHRIEGKAFFVSTFPVEGTSWTVAYYRSASDAGAAAFGFLARLLLSLLFVASAAVVCLRLIGRGIRSRFDRLLGQIAFLASGDWPERNAAAGEDPWAEFGAIQSAFAEMADRVAEREEEIRRSEVKYRGLFMSSKAPALIIDGPTGSIVDANPAAEAFYGRPRADLRRMRIQDINTMDEASVAREIAAADSEERNLFRFRHRLADGRERDVEVYSSPVVWDDERRLHSIVIDVTERTLAEQRVARSLEEKEVLLREIHHRVKNNLQIMASLLSLQASRTRDPEAAALFKASQDRVLAMASIHEMLYQRDDLASVDLGEYLESLVSHYATEGAQRGIVVAADAESIPATPDTALPVGLVANELLANCLKHAFPGQRPEGGRVEVRLRSEGGAVLFSCADDGAGLPPGVDPLDSPTLGFTLIRALSAQIGASAEFGSGPGGGFRFEMRVPRNNPAPA